MAAESRGCRPAAYSRRRPEQTVLYRVVQHYLETYLVLAREGDWDGHAMPPYVERDFRRYLECGILAYGFARAYCTECGRDFLVAFSCKGRAVCPSCNARRMAETAAHLVDHVFPPSLRVRSDLISLAVPNFHRPKLPSGCPKLPTKLLPIRAIDAPEKSRMAAPILEKISM